MRLSFALLAFFAVRNPYSCALCARSSRRSSSLNTYSTCTKTQNCPRPGFRPASRFPSPIREGRWQCSERGRIPSREDAVSAREGIRDPDQRSAPRIGGSGESRLNLRSEEVGTNRLDCRSDVDIHYVPFLPIPQPPPNTLKSRPGRIGRTHRMWRATAGPTDRLIRRRSALSGAQIDWGLSPSRFPAEGR
jgi:hypothetical protein